MKAKRRDFITAVGCGCLSAGLVGRARAEHYVNVQAEFRSAAGASLEGHQIEFFSWEGDNFDVNRAFVEDGRIDLELPGGVAYEVTFFKEPEGGRLALNDVPLVYGVNKELMIQESATDLGVIDIPEGHLVDVRLEDLDGRPVEGLSVGFIGTTGSGTSDIHVTTTDGYVRYQGNTETGVVLSGDVEIEVRSPDEFNIVDRLTVTEPGEFVVPLRDPEQYGGTVQSDAVTETEPTETETPVEPTPTETPEPVVTETEVAATETEVAATETPPPTEASVEDPPSDAGVDQPQRGFLTNDADSSVGFLNDPVRLTWAGIAASILGMVAQLVGRQS